MDEGWGEEYDTRSIYSEVDTPSAPKMSPLIYQDRALTDEGWSQTSLSFRTDHRDSLQSGRKFGTAYSGGCKKSELCMNGMTG